MIYCLCDLMSFLSFKFAAASNSGKLLCLMDSGNIVVCDLEFALKSALEEKKDQSREDASVGKSEAKVSCKILYPSGPE